MVTIKGRVINKIQGFYYVDIDGKRVEARLRGSLKRSDRKENCVVGDIVTLNEENAIVEIEERQNLLLRPVVANIDHLIIQFAAKNPVIDYERLNILILHSFKNNIKPIIVINKIDLIDESEIQEIKNNLIHLPSIEVPLFFISTEKNIGIKELEEYIKDKVTAFSGPSGVGKSSIINMLQSARKLVVGATSERLKRGKHTTRDSNLLPLEIGGFIIDTPGFSSLELPEVKDAKELLTLFPDFRQDGIHCKFSNCLHLNEPECGVKEFVELGKISQSRYDFYKKMHEMYKQEKWNKY